MEDGCSRRPAFGDKSAGFVTERIDAFTGSRYFSPMGKGIATTVHGGESDAVAPDRIVVRERGVERTMTVEEFLAVPLTERVRLVLERAIHFYAGGREV